MKAAIHFFFAFIPGGVNKDIYKNKQILDPRQVCKLEFVRCTLLKKSRPLYLSRFCRGALTKFKNTFFQVAKLKFSNIFDSKNETYA